MSLNGKWVSMVRKTRVHNVNNKENHKHPKEEALIEQPSILGNYPVCLFPNVRNTADTLEEPINSYYRSPRC